MFKAPKLQYELTWTRTLILLVLSKEVVLCFLNCSSQSKGAKFCKIFTTGKERAAYLNYSVQRASLSRYEKVQKYDHSEASV